ncbi:type 1 glutamine amidotransferase [Halorussus sp. AFM4]|uniref:type 1 glutamine amidotransferase n=1 Tax=Halorussus sp. AFM4 TaxID=3421651 RepID=UPI003EBD6639
MEFALLDASHLGTPTRRNFRRELDAELTAFDAKGGDLPPTRDYDGAVVTGSRSSVNDDEAWIDDLETWVAEALDRDVPVLGVCFGQQLLVDALGGEVESMSTYELGYHQVHRTGDSRLLDGADEWFVAFTAHSDAVAELPPGAERLAENNFSLHAFRKGAAFGVQFHPDFDLETAKAAMEYKDVDDGQIRRVLDQVQAGADRQVADSKRVFENFERFARDRARDRVLA